MLFRSWLCLATFENTLRLLLRLAPRPMEITATEGQPRTLGKPFHLHLIMAWRKRKGLPRKVGLRPRHSPEKSPVISQHVMPPRSKICQGQNKLKNVVHFPGRDSSHNGARSIRNHGACSQGVLDGGRKTKNSASNEANAFRHSCARFFDVTRTPKNTCFFRESKIGRAHV